MTSEARKEQNRTSQATHRAKTKVKLTSFAMLLAALKAQTKVSQELLEEIERKGNNNASN